MSDNTEINIEELVEHHGGFIFPNQSSSSGVDENGEEFDHSFITQNGRVSYIKNEDDSFTVSLTSFGSSPEIEKRVMSFDQLKNWFYDPTEKYYKENISIISLES